MMDPKEKESGPPAANLQDEGLEFELTDLVEARRVLDNESVSQFDVATFVPPAHRPTAPSAATRSTGC
jgi:hypothetical protein